MMHTMTPYLSHLLSDRLCMTSVSIYSKPIRHCLCVIFLKEYIVIFIYYYSYDDLWRWLNLFEINLLFVQEVKYIFILSRDVYGSSESVLFVYCFVFFLFVFFNAIVFYFYGFLWNFCLKAASSSVQFVLASVDLKLNVRSRANNFNCLKTKW